MFANDVGCQVFLSLHNFAVHAKVGDIAPHCFSTVMINGLWPNTALMTRIVLEAESMVESQRIRQEFFIQ